MELGVHTDPTMMARECTGYNYLGDPDNDRINAEPLSEEEIMEQVRKIASGVEEKPRTLGGLSVLVRPPHVTLMFTPEFGSQSI